MSILALACLSACATIPATIVIEVPTIDPGLAGTLLPGPATPGAATATSQPVPATGGTGDQTIILYAIVAMVAIAVLFAMVGMLRRPDQ
jgi:hypothetical protein